MKSSPSSRPRGHPPRKVGELATHAVSVRFSAAEILRLDMEADARGMKVATLCHEILMAALPERIEP